MRAVFHSGREELSREALSTQLLSLLYSYEL
jgi:hypothetical protein